MLAGEFQVVCPWLLRELVDLKLWDDDMKNRIIANNGSIQSVEGIPDDIKAIYKTVWEISQKKVLDLAADRGAFICQSQSLNVHLQAPTTGQLTSMHFYGWKKGLKTGMYYLRTRPAAQAIQFTVDQSYLKKDMKKQQVAGGKTTVVAVAAAPAVVVPSASDIEQEPITPSNNGLTTPAESAPSSPSPSTSSPAVVSSSTDPTPVLSLDERTQKAAAEDPEFAAALERQRQREYEQAKLMCSLENKEACLMCSG